MPTYVTKERDWCVCAQALSFDSRQCEQGQAPPPHPHGHSNLLHCDSIHALLKQFELFLDKICS